MKRLKDNWYVFLFLVPLVWAIVADHFTVQTLASEVEDIKEVVKEQVREQSRNQREINQKLTDQDNTNGRIEATQVSIQRQLDHIIRIINGE